MGLSCDYGDYEPDVGDITWYQPKAMTTLKTTKARKCCSCGAKIRPGEACAEFERYEATNRSAEYGDDGIRRASWYHCASCGNVALFLFDLKYSFHLENDVRELAKEHEALRKEGRAGCL